VTFEESAAFREEGLRGAAAVEAAAADDEEDALAPLRLSEEEEKSRAPRLKTDSSLPTSFQVLERGPRPATRAYRTLRGQCKDQNVCV